MCHRRFPMVVNEFQDGGATETENRTGTIRGQQQGLQNINMYFRRETGEQGDLLLASASRLYV